MNMISFSSQVSQWIILCLMLCVWISCEEFPDFIYQNTSDPRNPMFEELFCPKDAPSNFVVSEGTHSGEIRASWDAVEKADSYFIERIGTCEKISIPSELVLETMALKEGDTTNFDYGSRWKTIFMEDTFDSVEYKAFFVKELAFIDKEVEEGMYYQYWVSSYRINCNPLHSEAKFGYATFDPAEWYNIPLESDDHNEWKSITGILTPSDNPYQTNYTNYDYIVCGAFKGTTAPKIEEKNTITGTYGEYNGIMAKYSNVDAVQWVKTIQGSNSTVLNVMEGSYVLGNTYGNGTITFWDGTTLSGGCPDQFNYFVLKLDVLGNILWARTTGSDSKGICYGEDLALYGNQVYIVGYFDGSDLSRDQNTNLIQVAEYPANATNNYAKAFLTSFDSDGELQDLQHLTGRSAFSSIEIDSNDLILCGGTYGNQTIKLNGIEPFTDESAPENVWNVLLLRLSLNSSNSWIRLIHGSEDAHASHVAITTLDPGWADSTLEYILLVGTLKGAGDYLIGDTTTIHGAYAAGENAFIAQFSQDGSVVWATSTTLATAASRFNAVATSNQGQVYAVGNYHHQPDISFGEDVILHRDGIASDPNGYNAFTVLFDSNGNPEHMDSVQSNTGSSNWNSLFIKVSDDDFWNDPKDWDMAVVGSISGADTFRIATDTSFENTTEHQNSLIVQFD